jgi:integral membrane protein
MPTLAQRPILVKAYVVFAWATGVMATILFFVGIPLQYLAHEGQVDKIVGVIHGVGLYPAYVVLSIAMAFRYRLSIPHMALMALAGLLPGLSVYVSIRTLRHIDEKAAAKAAKAKKKVPTQAKRSAGSAVGS